MTSCIIFRKTTGFRIRTITIYSSLALLTILLIKFMITYMIKPISRKLNPSVLVVTNVMKSPLKFVEILTQISESIQIRMLPQSRKCVRRPLYARRQFPSFLTVATLIKKEGNWRRPWSCLLSHFLDCRNMRFRLPKNRFSSQHSNS